MEFYSDIPRIYTAIAEWLGCMICIIIAGRRYSWMRTSVLSAGFLAIQAIFLHITDDVPTFLWIPCMIVAAGIMFFAIKSLGSVTIIQAGYLTACAFMFAEFAASFEWQAHLFFESLGVSNTFVSAFLLAGIYSALALAFYWVEKPVINEVTLSYITRKELFTVILFTILIFAFSNIGFVAKWGVMVYDIFNARTLIDLVGLAALAAFQSRVGELIAEREASNTRLLFRSQYIQYKNYQESMDFIHMKYHDLKHQIDGLRGEPDPEKRAKWLDAMEEELNEHELVEPTGNQVLDAVIGSKLLRARRNKIRLTYVINGELLSVVSVNDLCTIFGNALDNALENAVNIPDEEKRLIHMTVSEKKGYAVILISNYLTDDQVKALSGLSKGKLPSTTKGDKKLHGFGLKSIRTITHKYAGQMFVEVKNNWFELRIVIPINR